MLSALVAGVLFAVPQAHAVDIFIKKNKDAPASEENSAPRVFTTPKPAPSEMPPGASIPAQHPPLSAQPAPAAPHSRPAKAVCTPEDAKKMIAVDRLIDTGKDLSDGEEGRSRYHPTSPEEVVAIANLYLRCGAYLQQYKQASGKAPAKRPIRR